MFVLAVLSVIRSDLFGAKVDSRAAAAVVPQSSRTPKPAKPVKKRKGLPGSVTIADGPQAGVGATLVDEPVIIGRGSDCQIRLDDDSSSPGTPGCSSPRASGGSRTSAPPTERTWTASG